MKNCKLQLNSTCSSQIIIDSLVDYAPCDEEPFVRQFAMDNGILTILIMEEYYFRNNATLSITVIIEEQVDYTTVEIVSNGGKVGLMPTSNGAENSAVKKCVKTLKQLGFVETTN